LRVGGLWRDIQAFSSDHSVLLATSPYPEVTTVTTETILSAIDPTAAATAWPREFESALARLNSMAAPVVFRPNGH